MAVSFREAKGSFPFERTPQRCVYPQRLVTFRTSEDEVFTGGSLDYYIDLLLLLLLPTHNPTEGSSYIYVSHHPVKGTEQVTTPVVKKSHFPQNLGGLETCHLGNPSPATQNPDFQVGQLPALSDNPPNHQQIIHETYLPSSPFPNFPTFSPSVRDLLAWCDHQSHGHHLKCPLMCQVLMVQKSGDHQLRLVVFAIIYIVLYIPGGAEFLPSTVPAYIPQNTIVKQRNLQKSGELLMAPENSTKVEEMCFICAKNRNFNSCNM